MLKNTLTLFFAGMLACSIANGQLVNNGAKIFIDRDALIVISGDVKNTSGSLLNHGELRLEGNWFNSDANKAFNQGSTGKVVFSGADQKIDGTAVTAFPDLEFSGSGIKYFNKDAEVFGRLFLNDGEINVQNNTLTVVNGRSSAIDRGSGFINTDLGGKLIRYTSSTEPYIFPFGSSEANRYAPIEFIPQSSQPMAYSATMFNNDPSSNGYDVHSKREDVKAVFDRYFYLVDQVKGADKTNVKFYLNAEKVSASLKATSSDINQLLSWSNFRVWEKASTSNPQEGSYGDNLTQTLMFTSSVPITATAFTFGDSENPEDPLTFFNAFSPDGDGRNDTWTIHNIDLFPDNELTIFNRWGDEVYKSKAYSSAKAWDGGTLNSGTYYYVMKVNINGAVKNYKGFITMLKKE